MKILDVFLDTSPFCGVTDTSVLGDVYPGFESQGGSLACAFSPV